ncbi:unnamed protein product [Rotaria socialis]|uniref:RAP domain-containing protein n=1 Tax=Rotaria socialis TaxID=392032 RepID=A0A817Q1E9_9BILA|nr:unnamed protein product [Rotaria socialis]CAF4253810.1 unnamed protein product [Rotaria socialis]CAF4445204.1 unnamed protein product [Rotaria socialis]CAF4772629.1 unnamed protein product [Rotaria socialis]
MIRNSIINHSRWFLFPSFFVRYLSNQNRSIVKNFDKKLFDYFYACRLKEFNNNREQMSDHIRTHIESILKTSSALNYLISLNSTNQQQLLSLTISIEQLRDILFFAYEHNIKLNLIVKHLIQCVSSNANHKLDSNLFIELMNLLVLHQQKYYDITTKDPNEILQKFINHLELSLTKDQIKTISLTDLSLLCSAMYRLQISLKNVNLLDYIAQYLIDDEKKKSLSAVDKQNFIKMLTLSNYGEKTVAESLANRFNQSFEQHMRPNLHLLSYEIVRMTMRIGIYFSMFRFYSDRFFENCWKLIELESNSSMPSYRAKDIIQIMNTLIYMGYIRKTSLKYLDLIRTHQQMNQFNDKSERLVDVLAPLAMINCFPEDLLEQLFTKENLNRLTESRMKEKLFFISQSYRIVCASSQRSLLDQNYLKTLPHHLFGSWEIEKRKRPYFSIVMQRLLECVPDRLCVKSAFLLKHFKSPDIIICLNAKQQPQIIPNGTMKNISTFTEDDCSVFALQVLSEEELCTNESFRPLGLFYSKAHQLKKLKYIPVIVYPNDSLHQIKTKNEVFEWIVQRAQKTELLLNENLL